MLFFTDLDKNSREKKFLKNLKKVTISWSTRTKCHCMGLKMVGLTFLFLSDWDLFHRTFSRPNFRTFGSFYFRELSWRLPWNILIQPGCTLMYFDTDRMYFYVFWYRQDVLWYILIQTGCTLIYFDTDRMYFDVFWYSQDVLWSTLIQPGCIMYFDVLWLTLKCFHVL